MKIVSIIPARAGSKGIKNKNIINLANKPLIEHTFIASSKSIIRENYVLTDSKKIKTLASKYKINTEYERPKKVSRDNTSSLETFLHFCKWLKKKNKIFDYLVVLQPTSPLRNYKDINRCVRIIKKKKPLSLFSVSHSIEHPMLAIQKKYDRSWEYIIKRKKNIKRRQDFKIQSFFENGAIYIVNRKLLEKNLLKSKNNNLIYIMPKARSFDINYKEDIKMCEIIMRSKKFKN